MVSSKPLRFIIVVILCTFVLTAFASPARAATLTVNTSEDGFVNNGNCSLREAIRSSVLHVTTDACPAGTGNDLIMFSVSSVNINSALPTIGWGNIVSIYGGNPPVTFNINVPLATNVFTVNAGAKLNIQNVNAPLGGYCYGSFVNSAGNLSISNSTVRSCTKAIEANAGSVKIQSSTIAAVLTAGGNAALTLTGITSYGGNPYALYVGTGGATISGSKFYGNASGIGIYSLKGQLIIDSTIFDGLDVASSAIIAEGWGENDSRLTNVIVRGMKQSAIKLDHASAVIRHSTIARNTYGIHLIWSGISLRNSILANTVWDCNLSEQGGVMNDGNNIQKIGGCGNFPVVAPLLDADLAPIAGSPALNAGYSDWCLAYPVDIYGTPRSSVCDIGAIEK